ncbi:FHA domain-containing protein [Rhodocyclus tenuis]|uniref:FHA domain-containing protein n=1 Tax=Rhodocyclus tenuis TaxID=1066 RepID=UPI0019040088|nr:FHA domain-containing protein [Rhodocyclus tenuis]MBK1680292.1 hypothetical protein [Rhodocyclus tenuis]
MTQNPVGERRAARNDRRGTKPPTQLLAGIAGSARLYERLTDAEAQHAIERCLKRMARAVEGLHGEVVKSVGDELQAQFTSTDEAMQAATEMQLRITDLPPASGVKLAIRVGFHCGEAGQPGGVEAALTSAARLTALARAGQILTDAATLAKLSPLMQLLTRPLTPGGSGRSGNEALFEVLWDEPDLAAHRAPAQRAGDSGSGRRLCARHSGTVVVLDDLHPSLTIGRDAKCDLVVADRRASRVHARIERRDDRFVLIDQSTNGSFLHFRDEHEFFVRREEVTLRGAGIVSVATSANHPDADRIEFEHL